MDDPIYAYFSQNIETVSKEELLAALENALGSAHYWREACLLGFSAVQQTQTTFGAHSVKTSFKPFSLGQIVATPGALEAIAPERLLECLARHARLR